MTQVPHGRYARTLSAITAALVSTAAVGLALAQAPAPQPAPADAAGGQGGEEVIVTAQKRRENVQRVPIAVSAFSANQLEKQKIDGGPNLVLAVPNVKFSKGNFTGYNFAIRGIGSQLVAASGDAGVGIHFNNTPLVANNLFESEFFDVERVEVLRGPQGTLYGRNATGGVINIITNKATFDFDANARAEYGNYNNIKLRGMLNLATSDEFAVRVAGAYLKRDGFGENFVTGNDIDDRNLWAVRTTVSWRPSEDFRADFVWDHFQEDDNRSRIGRQLCVKDSGPGTVSGAAFSANPALALAQRGFFSQGCVATPVDAAGIFGTINTQATLGGLFGLLGGFQTGDALAGKMQRGDVYDIEATFDPIYDAKTDIYLLNLEWNVSENLKLTSLTAYTDLSLFTRQDYSRYVPTVNFNAAPNPINLVTAPAALGGFGVPAATYNAIYAGLFPGGVVNDPQNGRSNRFVTTDISSAVTQQLTTELRLQSSYAGPFNFNVGAIYVDYDTSGDYYVMFNTGTAWYQVTNTLLAGAANCAGGPGCVYIDPNFEPTREGRNYYDSYSPYRLKTYAVFGELYYEMNDDFKWTLGLRYTNDKKEVDQYPVLLGVAGRGLGTPTFQKVDFQEITGRFGFDWNLRDGLGGTESLLYAFYSRGYKSGGLNSPCSAAAGVICGPPTFQPEFVNAYEIGLKNAFDEGRLILNLTGFYYDYEGYQVSKIVNRASTNENIDAKIMGLEFESVWQPIDGLRLNANIGLIDTEITGGSSVDTFNRTQGAAGLTLMKSSAASNCVIPTAIAQAYLGASNALGVPWILLSACNVASTAGVGTNLPGTPAPAAGTNAGVPALGIPAYLVSDGVPVNLTGNKLPNVPDFTLSFGVQYTWEFESGWAFTLRGDYSYQSSTYSRIYNSAADEIEGWSNVNVTATLTSMDGWQIDAYVKNATDEQAITGTYLTDDSSGLFRNAFYTEPRTFGVGVSKKF